MTTTKDDNRIPSSNPTSHHELEPPIETEDSAPIKPPRTYAYLGLIIALIAVGCAFYALFTTMQLRFGEEQQKLSLLTEIARLKQQQTDSETKAQLTIQTLGSAQNKLASQIGNIEQNLKVSLPQRLYQKNDWLLFKARYYLELAQINAHWTDDVPTTIALLQQADTLLTTINEQQLLEIRQAIAKEIALLKASPSFDTAGILSQLDAAQIIVAQLPLKKVVKNATTPLSNHPHSWRDGLKDSLKLLSQLVVIRHHEEALLPYPSPEYEAILRERVHLSIQEAQWAVLRKDESLYQYALTQALNQINQSFEQSAERTQSLVKQLHQLQQVAFIQQKPILKESLPRLNQLIESKNSEADKNGEPS